MVRIKLSLESIMKQKPLARPFQATDILFVTRCGNVDLFGTVWNRDHVSHLPLTLCPTHIVVDNNSLVLGRQLQWYTRTYPMQIRYDKELEDYYFIFQTSS